MSKKRLNMYMGYSTYAGSAECAYLIFANTAKEAKKVFWRNSAGEICDGYLDVAVRRLRDTEWLYADANQKKLESNIPHEAEPKYCQQCYMWGSSPIVNGLCEGCAKIEREPTND